MDVFPSPKSQDQEEMAGDPVDKSVKVTFSPMLTEVTSASKLALAKDEEQPVEEVSELRENPSSTALILAFCPAVNISAQASPV